MTDGPAPPAGGRPRRAPLAAGLVLGAIAVVWWAWPSLAGHDERLGVLVVADPFLDPGRRPIELLARESGRSVAWERFQDEWCSDAEALTRAVDQRDPERLVLPAATLERCAEAVADALGGRHVIAVVEPGSGPDAAIPATAAADVVVDPERLVGRPGDDPRRPCEWWETCDGDGRIAVRDDSGALTEAGRERVARMIVAAL